jgi:hypothetical protein
VREKHTGTVSPFIVVGKWVKRKRERIKGNAHEHVCVVLLISISFNGGSRDVEREVRV